MTMNLFYILIGIFCARLYYNRQPLDHFGFRPWNNTVFVFLFWPFWLVLLAADELHVETKNDDKDKPGPL